MEGGREAGKKEEGREGGRMKGGRKEVMEWEKRKKSQYCHR